MTDISSAAFQPRTLTSFGVALLGVLCAGLAAWASLVPITSAVIAPGRVTAASPVFAVARAEGGRLSALPVREGDSVAPWQVVARVEDVTIPEDEMRADIALAAALVAKAGAEAELSGAARLEFPPELAALAARRPVIRPLIAAQEAAFAARQELRRAEAEQADREADALVERIATLGLRRIALERETALLDEERRLASDLEARGLGDASRRRAAEAALARLEGAAADLAAELSAALATRDAVSLDAGRRNASRRADAAAALAEAEARMAEALVIRARIDTRRDSQVLRAPAAGRVARILALRGAELRPGEPVLTILPDEGPPRVEAFISPRDRPHVSVGAPVRIRLAGGGRAGQVTLAGRVERISPDLIEGDGGGRSHYRIDIAVDSDGAPGFDLATLTPGLPAEVFLTGPSRTLLEILTGPLREAAARTFREP